VTFSIEIQWSDPYFRKYKPPPKFHTGRITFGQVKESTHPSPLKKTPVPLIAVFTRKAIANTAETND